MPLASTIRRFWPRAARAEIGATTSLFGYDDATARYLKATGREAIADAADAVAHDLRADDDEGHPIQFLVDGVTVAKVAVLTKLVAMICGDHQQREQEYAEQNASNRKTLSEKCLLCICIRGREHG